MLSQVKSINIKKTLLDKAMIIFLLVLIAAMSIAMPRFLTASNMMDILLEFSIYGVIACAMTFAIICGEFDLSVSSTFALSSLVYIDMVNKIGVAWAILVTLAVGSLIGFINGILVSRVKVHAFVVTLGMMVAVKGLALMYTNNKPINTPNEFVYNLGNGEVFGIPYLTIIFFVILLISFFVLKYTRFGRNLYATGGSYQVSKYAGINVNLYKLMVFVILGFASAFGGIMIASRMVSGSALHGQDLSLAAVAAVVIGGTSLSGGSGGVFHTLLGLTVVGVLFNALTLLGVQAFFQQFIQGMVLITVVAVDAYVNRSGLANKS